MNRRAGGSLIALLILAPPASAQTQDGAAKQAEIVLPAPPRSNPSPARVARIGALDIPQAAKDAGHNGTVIWTATIGADGKLADLALKRSSNSPAIDAAARAAIESAYLFPATDREGNKIEGTADVRLDYARWNPSSPGGGLEDYLCSDLVRETQWFAKANAGKPGIFRLENYFVSYPTLASLQAGTVPSPEERKKIRAEREADWADLLRTCRKQPDRRFLDMVEDPEFFREMVGTF